MPLKFLKQSGSQPLLTSVSAENPLPVRVYNTDTIPTEPVGVDTLFYGATFTPTQNTSASPSNTDLANNTDPDTPTIINASAYRRFILVGYAAGAIDLTVDLYARATDPFGAPLHTSGSGVWFAVGSFTVSLTAAGYFRLVLQTTDGTPLGWDQYRITVRRGTASANIVSVLRGER